MSREIYGLGNHHLYNAYPPEYKASHHPTYIENSPQKWILSNLDHSKHYSPKNNFHIHLILQNFLIFIRLQYIADTSPEDPKYFPKKCRTHNHKNILILRALLSYNRNGYPPTPSVLKSVLRRPLENRCFFVRRG